MKVNWAVGGFYIRFSFLVHSMQRGVKKVHLPLCIVRIHIHKWLEIENSKSSMILTGFFYRLAITRVRARRRLDDEVVLPSSRVTKMGLRIKYEDDVVNQDTHSLNLLTSLALT